jgi:hypothetical protein
MIAWRAERCAREEEERMKEREELQREIAESEARVTASLEALKQKHAEFDRAYHAHRVSEAAHRDLLDHLAQLVADDSACAAGRPPSTSRSRRHFGPSYRP